MNLGTALYNKLAGTSAVTALVADRIVEKKMRDNYPNPAIVLDLVADPQVHAANADGGPYQQNWQAACWGDTLTSARAVAAAVITALRDFAGTLGGSGGVTVTRIFYDGTTELFDPESEHYQVIVEFHVDYQ